MNETDTFTCSLCGTLTTGFGNNPEPLRSYEHRCCDDCNMTKVIPERMRRLSAHVGRGHYGIGKPGSN